MTSTLSTSFPETRKALADLQVHVDALEGGSKSYDNDGPFVLEEIDKVLSQVTLFTSWVAMENPARREMWRKRVVQLQEEAHALKAIVIKHVKYVKRTQVEVQERQALLQRRHHGALDPGVSNDEANLRVNSSLQRSNEMLDQYIGQSTNVLASLSSQREALKAARKIILDIGTRLGLSQTLLSAVTRRESGDFWIVIIGMIITVIVLWVVIRWVRG